MTSMLFDELTLPADTLSLVSSFLAERAETTRLLEQLSTTSEEDTGSDGDERIAISYPQYLQLYRPSYGLSQFWYSQETAENLARAVAGICTPSSRIAFLCCPSGYAAFAGMANRPIRLAQVFLFEYDERFASLARDSFVHYDFNHPEVVPRSIHGEDLEGSFDIVVVDPPYHAVACQRLISTYIRTLFRESPAPSKLVILTGLSLSDEIPATYSRDIYLSKFLVEHGSTGNRLKNDYGCYTSWSDEEGDFETVNAKEEQKPEKIKKQNQAGRSGTERRTASCGCC